MKNEPGSTCYQYSGIMQVPGSHSNRTDMLTSTYFFGGPNNGQQHRPMIVTRFQGLACSPEVKVVTKDEETGWTMIHCHLDTSSKEREKNGRVRYSRANDDRQSILSTYTPTVFLPIHQRRVTKERRTRCPVLLSTELAGLLSLTRPLTTATQVVKLLGESALPL